MNDKNIGYIKNNTILSDKIFWVGAIAGLTTLFFFMYLVLQQDDISCSKRFPIRIIIALGAALASSLIGGWATANGKIAFLDQYNAIKVAAGGGIAFMIIMLLITKEFECSKIESERKINIGWIFLGYIETDKYIDGPYGNIIYRSKDLINNDKNFPNIGDVLKLVDDRNLRIVAYKKSGLEKQFISPPLANTYL